MHNRHGRTACLIGVTSQRWCTFGRFGSEPTTLVTVGVILLCLAISRHDVGRSAGGGERQDQRSQAPNFIQWRLGLEIELSADRRLAAFLEGGNERWVSVWGVTREMGLGKQVYTTRGRDFLVQNLEWVGHYLLMLVLDGVRNLADLHGTGKGDPEYLRSHSRILLWDSSKGTESQFLKGDFEFLFAHPTGQKVLVFHRRSYRLLNEDVGECRVSFFFSPGW